MTFSYRGASFPVGRALVDTGADITILPFEVSRALGVRLDDTEPIRVSPAGGHDFVALPSLHKVRHSIDKKGFRSIQWEGIVYFADSEPLLGHHQCLGYFDLTFQGAEKMLSVLPRFKT